MGFRHKLTRLRPGTVTAAELADGSVTAPKLVASAVTAGKIDADAVSVRELTVGGLSPNLVPNGAFDDGLTGWTVDFVSAPSGRAWDLASANAVWGAQYAQTVRPNGAPTTDLTSSSWPVRGGEWLNLSALVASAGPSNLYVYVGYGLTEGFAWGSRIAQVAAAPEASSWYTLAGAAAGNPASFGGAGVTVLVDNADLADGPWFELRARFQVPTEARWARVAIFSAGPGAICTDYLHGVDVRRSITGDLVVNGSIDGKVITGAEIRTDAGDRRIVLNDGGAVPDKLRFYNVVDAPQAPAEIWTNAQSLVIDAPKSIWDRGGLVITSTNFAHVQVLNRTTGGYAPIYASSFVVGSSRDDKTDVAELGFSALAALGQARVTRWRYRDGVADAKERIGPMLEDLPALLHGQARGDGSSPGINVATYVALVHAGLAELAARVEALERRLA